MCVDRQNFLFLSGTAVRVTDESSLGISALSGAQSLLRASGNLLLIPGMWGQRGNVNRELREFKLQFCCH